jgi:hypothetical protein
MDKREATRILAATTGELRRRSRNELQKLLSNPEVTKVRGESGTTYQVEAQAAWDDKQGHDLRVLVSIDDGGWRSFAPMSNSFIVAPDGSFVGE